MVGIQMIVEFLLNGMIINMIDVDNEYIIIIFASLSLTMIMMQIIDNEII